MAHTFRTTTSALLIVAGLLIAAPRVASSSEPVAGDPIDLVIVLDVSGTMRTLADSARIKIWEIVNELAIAEPTPQLRVALVTYGNQNGSEANGWVRIDADLTEDLDLISERLFALRSRGANEYVGRAMQAALERLSWSESAGALQFLFLVGNEAPDQDPYVRYQEMSELARQRGILLSAVFCGQAESPEAQAWKDMATLAEGQFASIDHRLEAVMTSTAVDGQLVELGELMNQTYVPYTESGKARNKDRAREDKNARKRGTPVAATRAMTKASPVYSSEGDLVTAHDQGLVDVLTLDAAGLPRSLRTMTAEERLLLVQEMSEIRRELRDRIAALGAERRRIVKGESASPHQAGRAFDDVLRKTIRERAQEAGFQFPEE